MDFNTFIETVKKNKDNLFFGVIVPYLFSKQAHIGEKAIGIFAALIFLGCHFMIDLYWMIRFFITRTGGIALLLFILTVSQLMNLRFKLHDWGLIKMSTAKLNAMIVIFVGLLLLAILPKLTLAPIEEKEEPKLLS